MRIIRGQYRGKQITAPKNLDARPTTDFAKEGLFNILDNSYNFETLDVLDLFAGTGNIGFEFLSRGAKSVVAVEVMRPHASFIHKTGESLFGKKMRVITADAFKFAEKSPLNYDIVFADPPYDLEGSEKLPDLIFASNLLKPNLLFVMEHSDNLSFKEHPHFEQERNYGKVHFSFFRKKVEE